MNNKNIKSMRKEILQTAVELVKKIKKHQAETDQSLSPTNDALAPALTATELIAMDVLETDDPAIATTHVNMLLG